MPCVLFVFPSNNDNLGGYTLQDGDTVTISAGAITTSVSVTGTFTSGTYTIFLADDSGDSIDATVVPEPSECAAGLGALALLSALVIRRRRAA